jgi:two-component system, cell cycle response regulator DivK
MPKTILVVEDHPLNMKLSRDLLGSRGYVVLEATTGGDALKLAKDRHPDLILMDIQLPDMSGLVVTRLIKGNDELRSIPIIAVTAMTMKGDEEMILKADATCTSASQ